MQTVSGLFEQEEVRNTFRFLGGRALLLLVAISLGLLVLGWMDKNFERPSALRSFGTPRSIEAMVQEKADEYYDYGTSEERQRVIASDFNRLFREGTVLTPVARKVLDDYFSRLETAEWRKSGDEWQRVDGRREGIQPDEQQWRRDYNRGTERLMAVE